LEYFLRILPDLSFYFSANAFMQRYCIDIQNILVKFKNGEIIEEPVGLGYIISSKPVADVEAVELYDHNGLLQSDLNDLRRYGSVFTEASFMEIQ